MRTTSIARTFFMFAVLGAANASAQLPNLKPGLWQLDVTMPREAQGSPMADMLEKMRGHMASLPPDQRKELQKTLADLGANGTEFTGNGLRTKQCITKESIAQFDLLGKKAPDSCTRRSSPTADGVKVNMTCTQPQMKVDAALKFQGEKAYTFESLATVTGPDGQPMTQKSSGSGEWLGSDCGKIKPASSYQ